MSTLINNLWPIERVYIKPPIGGLGYPPSRKILKYRGQEFQPEYLAAVESETEWVYDPFRSIPDELRDDVGAGRVPCPICGGNWSYPHTMRGKKTGAVLRESVTCPCRALRRYHIEVSEHVPERFRGVHLETIVPSAVSRLPLDRQQVILDHLRKYPTKSYLLWGEAATSKTHFLTGLYSNRVWHHANQPLSFEFPVVRVQTATLLEQILAHSFDAKAPKPAITARRIASLGKLRPSLFLDEIDKFNVTEARLDRLLEIVNAMYECKGQIVATSNKDPETLADSWGKFHAEAILRRIGTPPDGDTIAFTVPELVQAEGA